MPPRSNLKCPDRASLQELLYGSLASGRTGDLIAHLDTCVDCQTALETMAIAGRPAPTLEPDSETTLEPALRQAMGVLESHAGVGGSPPADVGELPLEYLESPAEGSSDLGKLGRYEIRRVIRRGGMGWILQGFDRKLNRVVAIKVISPHFLASVTARQRFAREAQWAGSIRNEHVIDIYSVEETAGGVPYLVMEFVAGPSLQDMLNAQGAFGLNDIVRIGIEVAQGLAAAHRCGVIHRDVKPANILIEDGSGRVKITDFGLARAIDDPSLTQSGVVAGTPQYMSPEQARAEPVDYRTDLFSLGSVLYAMCTGRPPFRGDASLAVLNQICDAAPRPIRESNPDIPEWLVQVIAKLLAKRPGDRFDSAAEVVTALEQQIQRTSPRRRFPKWAAIVLLALSGLAVSEATHVTNLSGVVIRVFTPDGILVVDLDDPAVKVTIEDNGKEVIVTGAGIQEVRLRTGDHKIQATRDGKALPLPNDVVTITRGEKQIVRVRREDNVAERTQERLDQAVSLCERGVKLRDNNTVDAERVLRQSLALFERLQSESSNDTRYRQQLERCRWYLGSTLNLQAARLLRNPRITEADTKRALELSLEATKRFPTEYWENLALGQYRAKNWKAALAAGEKTAELHGNNRGPGWVEFVVAMAHWQLGEKDKAREYYDRAVVWMDKSQGYDKAWAQSLRAEAAQLLGIAESGK